MAFGGSQPGAGRPRGSLSKVTAKAKMAAMETGLLPHEWLLAVSRGECIKHKRWVIKYDLKGNERSRELVEEDVYADFPTRLDAAKAAAPFYAAKLAAQTISINASSTDVVADAMKAVAAKLPV